MTDRAQFEAMLEALINEDQESAKEIFHNIVVGKSREIYEELLESEFDASDDDEEDTASDNPFDSEEDDSDSEEDDSDSEEDDSDDEFGDDDSEEEPDFGDEESEEGDYEDRILDLEDAIDELRSELDQLMAGEENEPEHADMFGGEEDEFGGEEDEFGGEEDEFGSDLGDDDSNVKEVHVTHSFENQPAEQNEFEAFMEYVNKVALPKHGDNGVQTRSPLAGKNDMGGTTANIARGGTSTTGGTQGGLLKPTTQKMDGGNQNVPGNSKAPKLKPVSKGHGAERKGQSGGVKAYGPVSGK